MEAKQYKVGLCYTAPFFILFVVLLIVAAALIGCEETARAAVKIQSPKAASSADSLNRQMLTVAQPPNPLSGISRLVVLGTNTNSFGPVGRPIPVTNVSTAWLDSKLTNSLVVGYNIYCSQDPSNVYQSPPTSLTSWKDTNSLGSTSNQWVIYTLSNIVLGKIYTLYVMPMASNGVPAFQTNVPPSTNWISPEVKFMAEKSLAVTYDGIRCSVSFMTSSNHTYTLQASPSLTGTNWTNLQIVYNAQGLVTFPDNRPKVRSQFYRLVRQ